MQSVEEYYVANEILRATRGSESISEKCQRQAQKIEQIKAENEASSSISGEIKITMQTLIQALLNPGK